MSKIKTKEVYSVEKWNYNTFFNSWSKLFCFTLKYIDGFAMIRELKKQREEKDRK